jgi:uncharacterized membrane protein HdeD (DUF308 family)
MLNETERSIYYRTDSAMTSAKRPAPTAQSTYVETHISKAVARDSTSTLRRLYVVRFAFAIAWAALLATTASSLGAFAIALLIVYPVFDVAAAIVDGRSAARAGRWPWALVVNIAISVAAAAGLAIACGVDIAAVLRVWGAWAIAAGAVQLLVGWSRRTLGGQWPMVLSGGISIVAGGSFILSASDADSLGMVAGYAVLGGLFFLASTVRLGR